jgi:hypothetical protein
MLNAFHLTKVAMSVGLFVIKVVEYEQNSIFTSTVNHFINELIARKQQKQ